MSPPVDVHLVALPALDGGTVLVNLVDLVAITPEGDDGSLLHLRYGGEIPVAWTTDRVADELAAVTALIAERRKA